MDLEIAKRPGIQRKGVIRVFIIAGLILLIPLIAMQVSDEWDWGVFDFVLIGSLLVGAGLTYEYLASRLTSKRGQVLLGLLITLGVLAVWAELAVGAVEQLITFIFGL